MSRPPFLVVLLAGLVTVHAAEPHPSLPPPVIPDCLGVNIHFTDPRPGEMEMLAAAGFKWVRMDFGWGGTERKKGEYDFSAYDRLVAKLDQFKIRAVFILDYGNPLYADPGDQQYFTSRANTPEFREAFGKWAVATVQHFKGRGYLWEMWNEPNGGFWKSPDKTGDYIALAKSTGEALRHAGLLGPKGEAYIGPATSTIDLPYLEACFKAGLLDYWDAVSVHPYRQNAPETVEEEYRSVRLLIRQYAPKDKVIPIISGEWGYSGAWPGMGKDETARAEQQGKYLPREFLTNMANDVALSIWYDWHDDGTDPKDGEHRFGIVSNEYHAGRDPVYDPKPAYIAMKTLAEQLGHFRFSKSLKSDVEKEARLLFARADQTRIAAWQTRLGHADGMNLFRSEARFDVVSYLGEKRAFLPGDLSSRNIFDDAPHYLTPVEDTDIKAFQVAAAWERVPLEFVTRVPSELTGVSRVKNEFPFPLALEVGTGLVFCGMSSDAEPLVKVSPGGVKEESFQIPISNPTAGQSLSFELLAWLPGWPPVKFYQDSRIEILNPMGAELLPPTDAVVPIRISNPSGAAVSGTASYIVDSKFANPDSPSQPFLLKDGQRETIIQFPLQRAKNPKGEMVPITNFGASSVEVRLDGGSNPFFLPLGIPIRIKGFVSDHVSVWNDGDAHVRADISVADGLPEDGAPAVGGAGVRVAYTIGGGWKFCQLKFKHPDEPMGFLPVAFPSTLCEPVKYCLWLHGDGKGCQARARFTDATGQTFQPDGPKIDWKGWRYVTFPMQSSGEKPLSHWGGANDGVIHYPIKWDTIFLLDNVSRQAVEGEIYLSAPTLIY
jgi:polysaccharide biosynthesis protein PslG